MAFSSKPRKSGLTIFWTLLASIERVTQLESQALADRDFQTLSVLQDDKRLNFTRLEALGKRLGITRSDPHLDERLIALAAAEMRNAEAARRAGLAIQTELRGLASDQRQLSTLRSAYGSEEDSRSLIAEG